jgi:hypothetical protein
LIVGVGIAAQWRSLTGGDLRLDLLDDASTLRLPFPHSIAYTICVVWSGRLSDIDLLLFELAGLALQLSRHGDPVGLPSWNVPP